MGTIKKYVFAPTGEQYFTQKDLEEAANRFYSGDLSEEFAVYYAKHSIHAFWINYKACNKKVKKQDFQKHFTILVNEMLKKVL